MKESIKKLIKMIPIPLSKNHGYDLQTNRIFKKVLKTNSNCIDVGCHKGEILDLMNSHSPQGQHFGFEPIPVYYEALVEKYKTEINCNILKFAASNEAGSSSFNFVHSNPSYSGLKKRDYDRPNEEDTTITVKTERIDHLIPTDLKIDLIKVDVEGAELQVFQGAEETIRRSQPHIVFEHGLGAANHYGTTPEAIFDFLHSVGLQISKLNDFLAKKNSLSRSEFMRQFNEGINYYFIAHPGDR